MTQPGPSTARKARRPLAVRLVLWGLYGLGFLVVLFIAALAWLVLRDRFANARLQEQIGELKAASLPHDNASLAEYYARATDERDVERWVAVLNVVQSDEFSESARDIGPWQDVAEPVPPPAQPWPDEAQTVEFLQTWSELRNEARQLALEDRRVRLPIEFDSLLTDLTLSQNVRQLARLFYVEAQIAIRNRDSAAAREAILAIFGCARAVEAQPMLVSQLLSTAHESMACEHLRLALEADVLNIDDLKRVQARIDRRPSPASVWATAINGERGGMLPMFTQMREYLRKSEGVDPGVAIPLRSRDALAFLEFMGQAADLPADDLNAFYAGAHELTELMEQKFGERNWLARFDTMLSTMAMPAIAAASDAFIQREMLARLATLGIGVRVYEDEHKVLPDSLEQLSEVGLDVTKLMPLGDQPFGYRKENEHATLWGFQVRLRQSTPADPPQVPEMPVDEVTTASMNAEANRRWVWHFPTRADDANATPAQPTEP